MIQVMLVNELVVEMALAHVKEVSVDALFHSSHV